MSPAEIGSFDRKLFGARGHQPQHLSGSFADLLHHRAQRRGLLPGDGCGAAYVGQQNHPARAVEFLFDDTVQFRHWKSRGRQIFWVAVPREDVRAGVIDRAMSRDQHIDGIVLSGPVFQKAAQARAYRGRGGLLIRQHKDLAGGNRSALRARQEPAECGRVGVGILQPKVVRKFLILRNPDQQRPCLAWRDVRPVQ